MRTRSTLAKLALALGGLVVAVGVAAWLGRDWLLTNGLGIVSRIVDPIGDTQQVVWEAGPAAPAAAPGERPPNIVVILADDLGWNDLSWNGGGVGGGTVPTPHIDSIARAGFDLRAGYAGNATCAPSRAAILTGRYPTRYGFEFTPAPKAFMRLIAMLSDDGHRLRTARYFDEREGDVPPLDDQGIPPAEVTLAELLRDAGYHTLGLGKWHLGATERMRPGAQGFDEYLGFYPGGAMYMPEDHPDVVNSKQDFDPIDRFLWANLAFAVRKDGGPRFEPDAYLTDYLGDQAVAAIDANRHRPFFLYLAYNAPHTPLQALRSDVEALAHIADPTERVYGAMIRALDRSVGRVLDALREHGLERDTLVVFTSDNGGADYVGLPDLNAPFRGWKMTFFEGGVHAPFFVKWPARLPAGGRYALPVAHVDVFATAAAAAGAAPPTDRPIDGRDLVPYLRGEASGPPHEQLYWRSGHYRSLVTGDGRYKLQRAERPARTWLFDLHADPTEQRDVSAERPDVVAELARRLDALDAEMTAPAWPSLIEGPISIDKPLDVAQSADDEFVYWPN